MRFRFRSNSITRHQGGVRYKRRPVRGTHPGRPHERNDLRQRHRTIKECAEYSLNEALLDEIERLAEVGLIPGLESKLKSTNADYWLQSEKLDPLWDYILEWENRTELGALAPNIEYVDLKHLGS